MKKSFTKFWNKPRNRLILFFILLAVSASVVGFVGFQKGLLGRTITTSINNITQPTPEEMPEALTVLQNKATLTRGTEDKELSEGDTQEIVDGDRVVTDLNGSVLIVYQSGTVVRVGPESTVILESNIKLIQEVGKVYVRFRSLLGIQESFEVESSDMVAAVRGTAFSSFVKEEKDTKVVVSESQVDVTPKDKDGKRLIEQKKTVAAGEQAVLSRLNRVLTTAPEQLSDEEKDWLDFNQQSDQEPDRRGILKTFRSLSGRTPTPRPTPAPSSSPPATGGTSQPTGSTITSMPGAGYARNSVATSQGTFTLACYGANSGSVRMLTDSASDSDCRDNCPVLPLADYATRNGGVAAMNGMYFCPADYPACAGKVNTFDTLFFNSRTRQYMNSANNVYSNIPFVGMNADHNLSFVGSSSGWGRDTGIIGGTAGNPRLMAGGNYAINLDALDDKQRNVKSNRGAIVQEGGMLYLCITQAATVPDSARVYEALGVDNAINVDGGGSSALWVGGSYKYGPGRNIPTAIILAP